MFFYKLVVLFLLCVLSFVVPAAADDLTLDQALESALAYSPLVAEIDSALAQREREARDISVIPNPELDLEQQFHARGAPGATRDQPSVSLIQPFRFSHLGLRQRVTRLKEESARVGKDVELLSFIQQVRFSYAHLWLLNQRRMVLEDINRKTARVAPVIDGGFKAAVFGKGEQAVFDAEVARVGAELHGIHADIARANSRFIALTGLSVRDRTLMKPAIASVPADLAERVRSGSLKVQKQMELLSRVAGESLRLAERDSIPELRPRLVYAGTNDGGEFYGVGLSMQLPFWNRNQNAIHAATMEKRSAEKSNNFYRSSAFEFQVGEIQISISSALLQLDVYEKRVLPGYQAAFAAFDQQLRAGQGTLVQLWQTLISLNDSSRQFSELWSKTFSERSELGILIQEDL